MKEKKNCWWGCHIFWHISLVLLWPVCSSSVAFYLFPLRERHFYSCFNNLFCSVSGPGRTNPWLIFTPEVWVGLMQTSHGFPDTSHAAVDGTEGSKASFESSGGHPPCLVFQQQVHNTSRGLISNTWRPRRAPPLQPQKLLWVPEGISPLHPEPRACLFTCAWEGFRWLGLVQSWSAFSKAKDFSPLLHEVQLKWSFCCWGGDTRQTVLAHFLLTHIYTFNTFNTFSTTRSHISKHYRKHCLIIFFVWLNKWNGPCNH